MSDSVVTHMDDWLEVQRQRLGADQGRSRSTLGGGDNTSGGMEGRLAKLEAHSEALRADMAAVKTDVGALKVSVATLTERVSHLPGKGFVIVSTTASLALLSGVIVFGEKLKSLLAG